MSQPFVEKVRKSHTGIDSSMDQDRTFIHHQTRHSRHHENSGNLFPENGRKRTKSGNIVPPKPRVSGAGIPAVDR